MAYVFTSELVAPILAVATDPVTMLWATSWVAAALGLWLRAVLPPTEDEALALALAGSMM
jgi:hypothetical protein